MSPHTGNPGIVRTVYSDISRNIQGHSAIFCHVQAYCTILRQSEAYSGIIETYEDLIGAWRNCCIYNHSIFRTLAYLKPEASSKACRTCKMIMHIHTPCIEQFTQAFSRIFQWTPKILTFSIRNTILSFKSILYGLPCPFWKSKKVSWFLTERSLLCPSLD